MTEREIEEKIFIEESFYQQDENLISRLEGLKAKVKEIENSQVLLDEKYDVLKKKYG